MFEVGWKLAQWEVRSDWKECRELLPLVRVRELFLCKRQVVHGLDEGALLYGSETWTLKADYINRLKRTDTRMVRWMCNISTKTKEI